MSEAITASIAASYRGTHERVLMLVQDRSDGQLIYQPNPTTPCIAFHVWHMARYADSLPNEIGAPGGLIWEKEGLLGQWGLDSDKLRIYESGTEMGEGVSASLPWPERDVIVDYARRAFEAAEQVVGSLEIEQLAGAPKWGPSTVGQAIMGSITHAARHLGMIETMRGVLGLAGLATM